MRRLSGLQKEVLALYRQCLRETRKKPQVRNDRHALLQPSTTLTGTRGTRKRALTLKDSSGKKRPLSPPPPIVLQALPW